jgi:hypothetical protein
MIRDLRRLLDQADAVVSQAEKFYTISQIQTDKTHTAS